VGSGSGRVNVAPASASSPASTTLEERSLVQPAPSADSPHRTAARPQAFSHGKRGAPRGTRPILLPHVLADLAQCLLLELSDALAGEVVLVADLFEGQLVLVVQTEAPANDARFDGRQRGEQTAHLGVPLLAGERVVGREGVVVLQEVDELAPVLVAHGAVEGERCFGPG